MTTADIKPLTGLRGAASLWVAAYHLLLPAAFITGLPARILGRGYLAVDLFFVLSGFVLALNYGARFAGPNPWTALPSFLWRRWARIFPLYGLILLTRLAYTALRYASFDLPRPWIAVKLADPWLDITANLLLVQSWGIAPSIIGPAWSVSTEWAAYWLFPLLAALLLHRRLRWALAIVAIAGACIVVAAASHGGLDCWDGRTAGPLLRCLGGFAIGMALWRLSTWPGAAAIAARPATLWAVCTALALCVLGQAPDLAIYPVLISLVLCLACGQGGPARWLGGRIMVWLGEVSYALYLLHIFLLHPLDQARAAASVLLPAHAADLVSATLILAVLLAAAHLAHHAIERPARAWATESKSFRGHFFDRRRLASARQTRPILLDSPHRRP